MQLSKAQWDTEMNVLSGAIVKAASLARTAGLSHDATALAIAIACLAVCRTEGIDEGAVWKEARRCVPKNLMIGPVS